MVGFTSLSFFLLRVSLRKSVETPTASWTLSLRRDFWDFSSQGISTHCKFKFKTSYFLLLNTTALSWFRVWLLLHARFLLFDFATWLRYGTITAEFTFSLSYCFKRWHTNDVKWWRYETVKGAWWRHQLRLSYYFHGVGYNGLPFLPPQAGKIVF